ncbi:MAG: M23 family metallopeptidase [Pseudomonadota bacterium]
MKLKNLLVLLFPIIFLSCSGSCDSDNGNNNNSDSLPDVAPEFTYSPFSYPNGLATDLYSLGIYTSTSGVCSGDNAHSGWDFAPEWSSYPEDKVPVIAVADGIITNILPKNTNSYNGTDHNTYIIWLGVSKTVTAHYTFEPFISYSDENYAYTWINVAVGDAVTAGQIIGYLPKVSGNLGETLIHLDFKVAVGADSSSLSYPCPLSYFSSAWATANETGMISKTGNAQCDELCK